MLNRLKISLILAPLALTILIGVYVYSLWSQERKRSSEIPVDATASMNRDLVKFHQKRGSFPAMLKDLEGVVWEKKDRNYVSDGHSMIHRNYFYLYSRIDQNRFTLWAIPIGKEREEASTLFLVGTPVKKRTWKGAAITVEDVGKLPRLLPVEQDLALRGMVEQVDHKAVYSNSK